MINLSGDSSSETLSQALLRFQHTDWTFADAKTNAGVHGIHPYPAKFVPQIPRHLLECFHAVVGGPVLDPFCGSGTTLVECQSLGIRSFGIDLNPIATLVSRVKTDPPTEQLVPIASELVESASQLADGTLPDIPRLDHWFTDGGSTALAKLTRTLLTLGDRRVRDALSVALSRIIVRVSRQESDTRYAAVDRAINESDVYTLFLKSAAMLDGAFETTHGDMFHEGAPAEILTKDILLVDPSEMPFEFGLIITSPPYPNAYEYWLYHKYRMYWLGEDPITVRNSEIGARHHYFSGTPATPVDFLDQMSHCFKLFRAITLPRAIVCVVVGRSIIRGQEIDNAKYLREAATNHGFDYAASATRKIPKTRKAFNPVHGTITTEKILIFSRAEQ